MRSAALTVTERISRLRNTHSAMPPIIPRNGGSSRGRVVTEMGIDDRRVIVRHDKAGHDSRRDRRRNGKHHVVVRQQRDAAAVELQFGDTVRREAECLQPAAEADLAAVARQVIQRGIDETFR